VIPTSFERRKREAVRTDGTERRRRRESRPVVIDELRGGWLAFQSSYEKRRLAPAPEGWTAMSDAQLRELLSRSQPVGRPRRLIE
jgi:hypothetical protein